MFFLVLFPFSFFFLHLLPKSTEAHAANAHVSGCVVHTRNQMGIFESFSLPSNSRNQFFFMCRVCFVHLVLPTDQRTTNDDCDDAIK